MGMGGRSEGIASHPARKRPPPRGIGALLLEDAIRRERDRFLAILEAMEDGATIISRNHDIEYANPTIVREFGPPDGLKCHEYFEGRQEVCSWCALEEVCAGKTVRREWRAEKTGKTYDVMDTPLRNADGSVSKLTIRRDITARKIVDERLQSLTRTLKGRVTRRTAAIKRQLAKVQALSVELAEAEESERRRLAVVLHDHLQQILSAAKLRLDGLAHRAPERNLQQEMHTVGDLLAEAMASARSLTVELCPPPLCEEGLAEAIRWLARHVEERHGLVVAVEAPSDALPNDPGVGALLFRIVNELLFNVVKHAGVKAARVRIGRLGSHRVRLVVSDAGVGFKQAGAGKDEDAATGLGLAGIRRRLGQLGGRLEIRSEPGRGTRVAVTAPMSVAPLAVTRALLKPSGAAPRAAARP